MPALGGSLSPVDARMDEMFGQSPPPARSLALPTIRAVPAPLPKEVVVQAHDAPNTDQRAEGLSAEPLEDSREIDEDEMLRLLEDAPEDIPHSPSKRTGSEGLPAPPRPASATLGLRKPFAKAPKKVTKQAATRQDLPTSTYQVLTGDAAKVHRSSDALPRGPDAVAAQAQSSKFAKYSWMRSTQENPLYTSFLPSDAARNGKRKRRDAEEMEEARRQAAERKAEKAEARESKRQQREAHPKSRGPASCKAPPAKNGTTPTSRPSQRPRSSQSATITPQRGITQQVGSRQPIPQPAAPTTLSPFNMGSNPAEPIDLTDDPAAPPTPADILEQAMNVFGPELDAWASSTLDTGVAAEMVARAPPPGVPAPTPHQRPGMIYPAMAPPVAMVAPGYMPTQWQGAGQQQMPQYMPRYTPNYQPGTGFGQLANGQQYLGQSYPTYTYQPTGHTFLPPGSRGFGQTFQGRPIQGYGPPVQQGMWQQQPPYNQSGQSSGLSGGMSFTFGSGQVQQQWGGNFQGQQRR